VVRKLRDLTCWSEQLFLFFEGMVVSPACHSDHQRNLRICVSVFQGDGVHGTRVDFKVVPHLPIGKGETGRAADSDGKYQLVNTKVGAGRTNYYFTLKELGHEARNASVTVYTDLQSQDCSTKVYPHLVGVPTVEYP